MSIRQVTPLETKDENMFVGPYAAPKITSAFALVALPKVRIFDRNDTFIPYSESVFAFWTGRAVDEWLSRARLPKRAGFTHIHQGVSPR
jgi:hypothetical protein